MSHEHSPFFQHFSVMRLDRFEPEEAVRFLTTACPKDRSIPEGVASEAARVVAAVSDRAVLFCDPGKARRGKEVRLTDASTIDNLPRWLLG